MRSSSFIGLVFLVIALVVASTPALLTPTAGGVEWALVKLDWVKPAKEASARSDDRDDDEPSAGAPVDPQLAFKGHVVEENGDLRDLTPVSERTSNRRGRLEGGNRRLPVPGQLARGDAYALPAVTAEGGVLLDATGCPHFDPSTDVATLMRDPAVAVRYGEKAAGADDPAACRALLDARITADDPDRVRPLPGDRRRAATGLRSDGERLLMEVYRVELFAEMMGIDEAARQELVDGARATIATG